MAKSCLTNIISFYEEIIGLVDQGRTLDIVFLDFTKAFYTLSHKIITEKLVKYGLGEQQTVRWIEIWLNGQAQLMAQILFRGLQLAMYFRCQCGVQSCLASSLMIWMMGASLQMAQKLETWLMLQRVVPWKYLNRLEK